MKFGGPALSLVRIATTMSVSKTVDTAKQRGRTAALDGVAQASDAEKDTSKLSVLVIGMHYAPEPTGNAPYTTGMVRAFADAGHSVRVITGYPHYPHWRIKEGYGGLRVSELDGTVPVLRVRHPVPARPTAIRRIVMDALFALHAAAVRGPRPDVVIVVSPVLLTVLTGLRWRRSGRTALGVVIQDLYSRAVTETGMASPGGAGLVARLERWLLNKTDGIAAVHENFARDLAELGVDRTLVSVIRNWTHVLSSDADRAATRRRLGWPEGQTIALHAGNMGLKQGLENVVEAARRSTTTRFVMLGDGGQRKHLETLAAGVQNIEFVDPLPDGEFEDALAAADVLVLNEAVSVVQMSVPSKLTSYFAAGRPVVAATHPDSAASVEIERSQAGVRVDPGDPDALLEAVSTLGRDSDKAEAMGESGRRYAQTRLSARQASQEYRTWIDGLAVAR